MSISSERFGFLLVVVVSVLVVVSVFSCANAGAATSSNDTSRLVRMGISPIF